MRVQQCALLATNDDANRGAQTREQIWGLWRCQINVCALRGAVVARSGLLYEMHERLVAKAGHRVQEFMAMEREQIWTNNSHYLSDSKDRFEDMLLQQLYGSGTASKPDSYFKLSNGNTAKTSVDAALSFLAAAGIQLSAHDLDVALARKQQKGAGEDQGLLELIAGTLAYFKVSTQYEPSTGICRLLGGSSKYLRKAHVLSVCSTLTTTYGSYQRRLVG